MTRDVCSTNQNHAKALCVSHNISYLVISAVMLQYIKDKFECRAASCYILDHFTYYSVKFVSLICKWITCPTADFFSEVVMAARWRYFFDGSRCVSIVLIVPIKLIVYTADEQKTRSQMQFKKHFLREPLGKIV